jgi:hypothetical protein
MGAAPGIAGSTRPELPAVFACDGREDVSFFLNMARTPADVWSIDVGGLWAENGPDGWWIISRPIGLDRLTLTERDVVPRPAARATGPVLTPGPPGSSVHLTRECRDLTGRTPAALGTFHQIWARRMADPFKRPGALSA